MDEIINFAMKELNSLPEKDSVVQVVSDKNRMVFLCFLMWIIGVSAVIFFSSDTHCSFIGPSPTWTIARRFIYFTDREVRSSSVRLYKYIWSLWFDSLKFWAEPIDTVFFLTFQYWMVMNCSCRLIALVTTLSWRWSALLAVCDLEKQLLWFMICAADGPAVTGPGPTMNEVISWPLHNRHGCVWGLCRSRVYI